MGQGVQSLSQRCCGDGNSQPLVHLVHEPAAVGEGVAVTSVPSCLPRFAGHVQAQPATFDEIDTNQDGVITREEFESFVRRQASQAEPPTCSGCARAMVWSDYSQGEYSKGWNCNNVSSCLSKRSNAGDWRWFCQTCENDYCAKCCAGPKQALQKKEPATAEAEALAEAAAVGLGISNGPIQLPLPQPPPSPKKGKAERQGKAGEKSPQKKLQQLPTVGRKANALADNEDEAPQRSDNIFNTLSSTFTASPFTTMDYEEMTKDQRKEAREVVKDFVKTMVRGRKLPVVTASGDTRTCFCALTRTLDRLKISAQEYDRKVREVPLVTIQDILVGEEMSADDLLVTLCLDSEQCITFRPPNHDERDRLVGCLTMLSAQAKVKASGNK